MKANLTMPLPAVLFFILTSIGCLFWLKYDMLYRLPHAKAERLDTGETIWIFDDETLQYEAGDRILATRPVGARFWDAPDLLQYTELDSDTTLVNGEGKQLEVRHARIISTATYLPFFWWNRLE